jgi:hypothetical protein
MGINVKCIRINIHFFEFNGSFLYAGAVKKRCFQEVGCQDYGKRVFELSFSNPKIVLGETLF